MTDDPRYFVAVARYLELSQRNMRYDNYRRALARGSTVAAEFACEPLTQAEKDEMISLRVETVRSRTDRLVASGLPQRFIDADGYAEVPSTMCRAPGCWQEVGDAEDYVMQWATWGAGVRWHREHAPAALFVPGAHTDRVIGNTGVAPACPWPDDTFIQGGAHGVVIRGDQSYATAFVEAFPTHPNTLIRGEGTTIAEAEAAAWEKYRRYVDCATAPEHGPWEKRGYTNGAGFCGTCGLFQSGRFEPEPSDDADPGPLERTFLGVDDPVDLLIKAMETDPEVGT